MVKLKNSLKSDKCEFKCGSAVSLLDGLGIGQVAQPPGGLDMGRLHPHLGCHEDNDDAAPCLAQCLACDR